MPSLSNLTMPALLLVVLILGCKNFGGNANSSTPAPNASPGKTTSTLETVETSDDGTIASESGTEKEKPAAGKGNVQGKALYNGQPAVGVEVNLCEKFNRFMGGCTGKKYTTKTDSAGEYLIKDVPPATYEGLTVRVFNSNYYVFATSGIVSAAKYNIESDKTFFAPDANLFKNDLKVTSPKMDAKLSGAGIEIKWDAYSDAEYYKIGVYADTASGAEVNYDYINKRVDGTSITLDKPLKPGKYWIKVDALNADDKKLSGNPEDVKFTVTP